METVSKILPFSFAAGLISTCLAAFMRLQGHPSSVNLMIIGLVFALLFMILALIEIWNADHFQQRDRVMWSIAVVFLGTIGGLIYFMRGRIRV